MHVVPGKFATVPPPQFGNRFDFGSISVRIRFDFGSNSDRIRLEFGSNSVRIRLSVRIRTEFGWNSVRIQFEFGCRFEFGSKSVVRFEIGSKSVRNRFEFSSKSAQSRLDLVDFELIWTDFELILNWFLKRFSPRVIRWAAAEKLEHVRAASSPSPHSSTTHPPTHHPHQPATHQSQTAQNLSHTSTFALSESQPDPHARPPHQPPPRQPTPPCQNRSVTSETVPQPTPLPIVCGLSEFRPARRVCQQVFFFCKKGQASLHDNVVDISATRCTPAPRRPFLALLSVSTEIIRYNHAVRVPGRHCFKTMYMLVRGHVLPCDKGLRMVELAQQNQTNPAPLSSTDFHSLKRPCQKWTQSSKSGFQVTHRPPSRLWRGHWSEIVFLKGLGWNLVKMLSKEGVQTGVRFGAPTKKGLSNPVSLEKALCSTPENSEARC